MIQNKTEAEPSAAQVIIRWPEKGEMGVALTNLLLITEKSGGDYYGSNITMGRHMH